MRPLTDSKNVSRAKLAFIIDANRCTHLHDRTGLFLGCRRFRRCRKTLGVNGIELFIQAIPFNFYSLLMIVFVHRPHLPELRLWPDGES